MPERMEFARAVSRVTCVVHEQLGEAVSNWLTEAALHTVLVEPSRVVRQRVRRPSRWRFGSRFSWDDSPMDLFRTTVARESASRVMAGLSEAAGLSIPGRGMVLAQDVMEYSRVSAPVLPSEREPDWGGELALITAILSEPGSGDRLARIALNLGVCVPVIGLAEGAGVRGRLGLLRVTIPADKEVVQLMVPRHDADTLQRILVEEGRMNRPGGGFCYQTPVRSGRADPLLRLGRQEHAASIEQIIAAVDELKGGTRWRRRVADPGSAGRGRAGPLKGSFSEVVFLCPEGRSGDLVETAMRSGADGATLSRVRCLAGSDVEGGIAARERGVLCLPARAVDAVVSALLSAEERWPEEGIRLQVMQAGGVYSHQRAS